MKGDKRDMTLKRNVESLIGKLRLPIGKQLAQRHTVVRGRNRRLNQLYSSPKPEAKLLSVCMGFHKTLCLAAKS